MNTRLPSLTAHFPPPPRYLPPFGPELDDLKATTPSLPAPSAGKPPEAASILQELCRVFDDSGPLKLSFADFTGVSYEVPVAQLEESARWHRCEFCLFAKNHHQTGDRGWQDCIRNKRAVNRLVIRRGAGLAGMCHLGITDLVEPVLYRGRIVGAFFYGSVVVSETLAESRERIERYCGRRSLDAASHLARLQDVPEVAAAELSAYRRRLLALCGAAVALLEAAGVPTARYAVSLPTRDGPLPPPPPILPPLVRRALADIAGHPDASSSLKEVAARLHCHPAYLGQCFKAATGRHLNEYLLTARLNRARRLLRDTSQSIGDIAFACGFDESHFGRVFKRDTGLTPQQFRRSPMKPGRAG